MIKTLRTPTVFVLLSVSLSGWLVAWYYVVQQDFGTLIRSNTIDVGKKTEVRPLYAIYRSISGVSFHGGSEYPASFYFPATIILVNGEYIAAPEYTKLNSGQMYTGEGEQIMAAARISKSYSHEYFGILALVAHRATTTTSFSRVGELPEIPESERSRAIAGFNRTKNRFAQGMYSATPTTTWTFKPLGTIHDFLFLLTLIAYLISLTAIPRWPIWKRITPTQRRRAKGQCPVCAYELKGLSTTTCPECGNRLDAQAVP
ncbi:MAG: hypothetical protein Phyf2KO_27540 [Phycisphaerales bacterium]